MDINDLDNSDGPTRPSQFEVIIAEVVPEPLAPPWPEPPPRQRKIGLPVCLFLATCITTLFAGGYVYWFNGASFGASLWEGRKYAIPVMTILLCHEMGHFVQAWRYGVYTSLPFFFPSFPPLGTFGAVIAMEPRKGDRRAVFDIGISGPLAGLIPTMIFLWIGLQWSHVVQVPADAPRFGDPLLVQLLDRWIFGPIPPGCDVAFHPMAFAGWVGLLVTSLNLIPIGQLDGGHILYGMLRKKAHVIARGLMLAAIFCVVAFQLWNWSLMLVLLVMIGTRHPPTADDDVPLGWGRYVLGALTLAFIVLGFTPRPFEM